jgi:hypothetical protein
LNPSHRIGPRRGVLLVGALAISALGGCAAAGHPESWDAITLEPPAQPTCRLAAPAEDGTPTLPAEGCWNGANLSKMVADPHDLVKGKPLGPANGARESLAVEAYQRGQTKPSPDQGTGRQPILTIGASMDTGAH